MTNDPVEQMMEGPSEDAGASFSDFFTYMRDMNAAIAQVIPSDEDERPIGGVFFFRGEDAAELRAAAVSVAEERGLHVEPGEGDGPWGLAIDIARRAGFEFVVTDESFADEATCSVVTVGDEPTASVRAAIEAVQERWEAAEGQSA